MASSSAPHRARVLALIAFAVAVVVLPIVAPASAHARDGRRWPGTRITYFDATRDKGAVRRAVAAWNGSGIRMRFVRTFDRARANVVIGNSRKVPDGCGTGVATLGYLGPGRQGWVRILHGAPKDGQGCAWPGQTLVVTHELGHVLGLGHDSRGCALMNTSHTNGVAPSGCLPGRTVQDRRAQWRCRIIEPRDLRRALAKYGGRARGGRANPWCDLVPRPGAIESVTATLDPQYSAVSVVMRRPADVPYPAWLSNAASRPYYEIYRTPDTCLAERPDPNAATPVVPDAQYAWSAEPGTDETWYDVPARATPGTYCWTAWAFDAFGRPSPTPASATLVVPETAPARGRSCGVPAARCAGVPTHAPPPTRDADAHDAPTSRGLPHADRPRPM